MQTEITLEMPFRFKFTIEDLDTKAHRTTTVEGISLEACLQAFLVQAREIIL
jgi:hypothetical protein